PGPPHQSPEGLAARRSGTETRLDSDDGRAPAKETRGLPRMPRGRPRGAAHADTRTQPPGLGEPSAVKVARSVRRGADGKGPQGSSPAAYPTSTWTGGTGASGGTRRSPTPPDAPRRHPRGSDAPAPVGAFGVG